MITPEDTTNPLKRVLTQIRGHLPVLVGLSCLVNLLMLVTAIYMLQIYDRVLSSGSLDTLLWLTVVALFAIAIYGILDQSRRMVLSRASRWLDAELNAPMLHRRMLARLAGQESPAGPRDVADMRGFWQSDAVLAFLDVPWSVIFLAFIWALHSALGTVATLGAVVLFSMTVINDRLTRKRQQEAATATRGAHEAALRYVDGGETIAPLGMAGAIFGRWRKQHSEARRAEGEIGERTINILSVSRTVRLGLQVMILGVGAYYVLAGQITAGAMIAASIIMSRALSPIERSTGAWRRYIAAKTAKRNLEQLFEGFGENSERIELPRPEGRLSLESVTYGAQDGLLLLRAVSFALEPGESCAIIGPSGAGKTSLCRVITGAWKPAAGHARLDGADIYDWHSEDLGPWLGYLPQKVELFPGTIAENIARFGELKSEEVIRAARTAGVHELILGLPKGYETMVGLHQDRISLGQKQRIGLARAIYGDPALIVLDEPNANLDEAGDQALLEALLALRQMKLTVLVVTHRASLLKVVDKVLVLNEGRVASFGEREQLLKPVAQTTPLQLPVAETAPDQPRPELSRKASGNVSTKVAE